TWIQHSHTILEKWGLQKTLKPGYRSLFYGPPGTGKTLTATLIGDQLGLDVYRIDLSSMVSKYIGETEKNLANLFDQAQSKRWILFFDEADALFGTRSQGSSANDRHANQQVAYLLQRIEDFPGIVILATNLRANIDEAFSRRFQSLIYFPMPDAEQRLLLWQSILNGHCELASGQDLSDIAEKYELSGGAITNVVRYAAICAIEADSDTISYQDLRKGVAKELRKEGRTL
ncbi:MAG: ATP-binding protein, partial [Psychrosphaera sp.]|nr:ATP-binding protein [Psychrosphaera sp.]